MTEKLKAPMLRFPGFVGDWEERKFGDIVSRESIAKESSFEYPYVEYEDVVSEEGRLNKDIRQKEGTKKGIVFDGSQVLYGKLRPYLHNWLNPDFSGVAVGDWWVLKPIDTDKNFIFRLIQTPQFDDISNLSAGSKMPRADWSLVSNTVFSIPAAKAEQSKIGSYFSNLDNLISVHRRKLETLKTLKKAMLQKMFPRTGEKIPEIRFPEFSGDWEEKKLGDVFKEYSEKKHEELPALTIIQGGGTILRENSDRNLLYDKSNLSAYKMVRKDDFIVHLRSFEGGLEKANSDGIISPAYHTLHGNDVDSRFYYSYFRSHDFINKKLVAHVFGIRDGRSIDIDGMKTICIPYTSYEEQKKIGDYLDNLDSLISLSQRKLETLKKFKKGFLQQMFV